MASVSGTSRASAPRSASAKGRSRNLLLGALLACGVLAGSAWSLVATAGAVQSAATPLAGDGAGGFEVALDLKPVARLVPAQRDIRLKKFSRLSPPSESEIRQRALTPDAVRAAHQRWISERLELAVRTEKAKALRIEAAFARAQRPVAIDKPVSGEQSYLTALVEDRSPRDETLAKPFGLVMSEKPMAEAPLFAALPETVPLPEARPALQAIAIEKKPEEEKPAARRTRQSKKETLAYAKPERSLFEGLFKGRDNGKGWPGKGTKVAIYDISGGTVHMPDGSKLEAHSGIGHMRDNPKYANVKMRGPTPPGTFRLTMREKRFHGVEALRMTSIDGKHPLNRTGLLTHSYLLGPNGNSHGCVAFKNYQPFLNAFKRGEVNMLVVVPKMPSSRMQIAALYRRGV